MLYVHISKNIKKTRCISTRVNTISEMYFWDGWLGIKKVPFVGDIFYRVFIFDYTYITQTTTHFFSFRGFFLCTIDTRIHRQSLRHLPNYRHK